MRPKAQHVSLLVALALVAPLAFPIPTAAQESGVGEAGDRQALTTGPRWGFQLGRYQDDFAFGLNLTSPFFDFTNERLAVRLRGNLAFHEHLPVGSGPQTETWSPYGNVSVGLVGLSGRVGESIRLYGEGGAIGLIPSDDFSRQSLEIGGYGLFGFSFFAEQDKSYFIEIGGVGIAARANRLPTSPVYSNGLVISVGIRGGL